MPLAFFADYWHFLTQNLDEAALLRVLNQALGFLGVLLAAFVVSRIVRGSFKRYIRRRSRHEGFDPTRSIFLGHLVNGLIYFVGIVLALYTVPGFRAISISLFAGSGIVAVIVGFASQSAFANLVGGVLIAIFKPFRVGDRIRMVDRDITGVIEDISLRHTILRTLENNRVIVPNSQMSDLLIENLNLGDERVCRTIDFGIAYGADIDRAMGIITAQTLAHPLCLDNRSPEQTAAGEPQVSVRVIALADSSVNLRAWVWAADAPSAFTLQCDLLKSVKEAFDREGIEIPFPHRTVVMKNS